MSGWPEVALSEIFDIARGGSPRPIDAFVTESPDGINWVTIGDASEGSKYITRTRRRIRREGVSRSREVKPGDFLLTNSMSFGRPYIMRTSGCIHDGWLMLSPRRKDADADFFYHLLGSKRLYSEFERLAAGATVKNLNIDIVRNVKVALPPLAEQRRIAAILDKADELRAKRRAAVAQLDNLTQAMFMEMFGPLLANVAQHAVPLRDCAEVVSGVTKGRKFSGRATKDVPYLRVANVQAGFLDLSEVKTIPALPDEIEALRLLPGDVVLTEGGDFDKLGRGAIWTGQIEDCIHQNHVFRVRFNQSVLPEYFHEYLQTAPPRAYFLRCAKKTTNLASINMTQLRALPVVVPHVEHQREFVRRANAVSRLDDTMEASLVCAETLFASLRDRAFSGAL